MGNLKDIRCRIRAKRRKITGEQREKLSIAAMTEVLSWLAQRSNFQHIATFLSLPEEIDTTPLNIELERQGYSLYLPYVSAQINQPLKWLSYHKKTTLFPDHAGIPAPLYSTSPAPRLDVVITPLVAFDHSGTRLGMGGGFYDRSFQGKIPTQLPILIGFAYPCQWVSLLPRRTWDIPLDACAIANQFFTFNPQI